MAGNLPKASQPVVDQDRLCTRSWMDFFRTSSGAGPGVVFANLPTVPVIGTLAIVTDSSTATWSAVVAGGGANVVGVMCDGTDWRVMVDLT